jgi:hypothetical protein
MRLGGTAMGCLAACALRPRGITRILRRIDKTGSLSPYKKITKWIFLLELAFMRKPCFFIEISFTCSNSFVIIQEVESSALNSQGCFCLFWVLCGVTNRSCSSRSASPRLFFGVDFRSWTGFHLEHRHCLGHYYRVQMLSA